jgi:hypothetical protein
LYVDLDTQLKLAKYKNAWVYNKNITHDQRAVLLEKIHSTAVTINDKKYFAKVADLIDHACVKINLLDLISDPDKELSKLGVNLNIRQQKLIQHWVGLHNGLLDNL